MAKTPKKKPSAAQSADKRATANNSARTSKGTKRNKEAGKKAEAKKAALKKTGKDLQKKSLISRLFYWGAVLAIWGLIAVILLFAWLAKDLPDLDDLPVPGAGKPTVVVKAVNGAVLARTGPYYADWVDVDELPEASIRALLSIEDRNFFSHPGVDGRGLLRAVIANLQAGGVRAGGSTLTQQLAKNIFLTNQRSFTRKAQELLLTFWLEQKFTKEQILALYINRVYFGGGAFGIDAASRKYFGHSARHLTVAESAILAGLMKAPSSLAPHINPEGAWKRAQLVLRTMVATGAITPEAAAQLSKKPPKIITAPFGVNIRYFTDWVTAQAGRLTNIRGKSVIIYTTLAPAIQRAATDSVHSGLKREGTKGNVSQAALIAMDHDGAVRAMVGGAGYQGTQYNRVTQALRQPGSAFKIFPYIAALEGGIDLSDTVEDAPINVDGYAPKNYSGTFRGEMTVREAFARSINTVAVRIAEDAGRDKVVEVAKRLGISTSVMPIASLPLGTEEVHMIDLAAAYAAIANGGHHVDPYAIVEIETVEGELLYRYRPPSMVPVLAYPVVQKVSNLLTAVVEWGSGKNAKLDRPAGGKTGTTQDNRDAVFAGFTSDLTSIVWVGNDDGSPMNHVTGGGLPARIWRQFNIEAHVGAPVRDLLADSGIYSNQALPRADTDYGAKPADQKPQAKKKKKKSLWEKLFGSDDEN